MLLPSCCRAVADLPIFLLIWFFVNDTPMPTGTTNFTKAKLLSRFNILSKVTNKSYRVRVLYVFSSLFIRYLAKVDFPTFLAPQMRTTGQRVSNRNIILIYSQLYALEATTVGDGSGILNIKFKFTIGIWILFYAWNMNISDRSMNIWKKKVIF